jgi:hypothetical protein
MTGLRCFACDDGVRRLAGGKGTVERAFCRVIATSETGPLVVGYQPSRDSRQIELSTRKLPGA